MACDVASPAGSGYQDSLFEDEWKQLEGQMNGSLDAVAAFNANFNGNENGVIDPNMLSSTLSPASMDTPFDPSSDLFSQPHGGHQFPPSVEQAQIPPQFFSHSPLRNPLHRRSVSEPPDQHHLPPQHFQQPQVPTFTRSGVALGIPSSHAGQPTQRSGKNRQAVYCQPFSVVKRRMPPPSQQQRYQLRRANTQPVYAMQHAPTSVPVHHQLQQPHVPMSMMPPPMPPQAEMFHSPPVVTSRVCTPQPSPETMQSPAQIDPQLMVGSPSIGGTSKQQTIATQLTVEELKLMIAEAVREAVKAAVDGEGGSGKETMPEVEKSSIAVIEESGPAVVEEEHPGKIEGTGEEADDAPAIDDFDELLGESQDIRDSIEGDGGEWQ